MAQIEYIVIHCSASLWGCAREIRRWHLERGWRDIGYQFVILNGRPSSKMYIPVLDGSVECGRDLDEDMFLTGDEVGAHALGYNAKSIGVCLIGARGSFTPDQKASLHKLLKNLCAAYDVPYENVIGHYETESGKAQGKTCPDFDVSLLRRILESGDTGGLGWKK